MHVAFAGFIGWKSSSSSGVPAEGSPISDAQSAGAILDSLLDQELVADSPAAPVPPIADPQGAGTILDSLIQE